MREVVIVAACRTAIGKFGGTLQPLSDIDFGPIPIKEVMKRAGITGDQVDEVIYASGYRTGDLPINSARVVAVKAGIPIEQLPTFLTECNQHIQLPIAGIMCIPPINQDPAAYFRLMQKLRLEYRLKELSMGMSDDYVEAISNGATMIRVGSKILVS